MEKTNIKAVIMAGGRGERMKPLTNTTPKPMLEICGKPIIDHIIERIWDAGIEDVVVSTGYKAKSIQSHLGDTVEYLHEEKPLGTTGALGLLENIDSPILVINGDILSTIDLNKMIEHHGLCSAQMTVGTREIVLPYGVIEWVNRRATGVQITGIDEKPIKTINAGIYIIEPAVIELIPQGHKFDMTELIKVAIAHQLKIVPYKIEGSWCDIGSIEEYDRQNNNE